MLQNAKVLAFIVSELLREDQQKGVKLSPHQVKVNHVKFLYLLHTYFVLADSRYSYCDPF